MAPGPVELEMPENMEMEDEVELLAPVEAERPEAPAANVLLEAAERLAAASRRAIYAGVGVHLAGAHEALRLVAEHLQAGTVESDEGKGALPARHPLALRTGLWPGKATYER